MILSKAPVAPSKLIWSPDPVTNLKRFQRKEHVEVSCCESGKTASVARSRGARSCMQVIAHNGPNWNPGALAVQACMGQIAVGVRSTVLLYDFCGRFTGEIRAVGRGRVTALAYCTAPALTHLLAVGTSDGFVRIFDAQTRRVFRKVREPAQAKRREGSIFAVRFVQRFPNVLLVMTDPNRLDCWRYEDADQIRCIVSRELDLQSFSCVEQVPGFSNLLLVGGSSKDDRRAGVVMVVDLSMERPPLVFNKGCMIYDLVARKGKVASGRIGVILVMVSAAHRRPFIFSSPDGMTWTAVLNGIMDNGGSESVRSNLMDGSSSAGKKNAHSEYRRSVTWCCRSELFVSDAKGTVTHWHIDNSHRLVEKGEQQSAHVRQVFSMKSLGTGNEFVSISMDRTIAAWILVDLEAVEPKILLKWRTLRTSGPVRALCLSRIPYTEQHLASNAGKALSESSLISFATSDNTITCIGCESINGYFMVGEVSPLGAPSAKRKRESISHLSSCTVNDKVFCHDVLQATNLVLFASSDKRLGIVKLVDGQLEFMCSNKQKAQNGSQQHRWIALVSSGTAAAVSISENGYVQNWILPKSIESWKESRRTSALSLDKSFTLGFGGKTPSASAVCVLPRCDQDKAFLFMGYEDGSLALFSPCGQCVVGPITTDLSQVTCIAYQSDSNVVAISDRRGLILTSVLDPAQFGGEGVKRGRAGVELKRHESLEEAVRHLTWSSSVPQSPSCSSETGVYLLAITDKGNILVWVYNERDCTLDLRAELKAHSGMVNSGVWENHKCLITAGEDGTIRKWDLERQPRPHIGRPTVLV